MTVDVLIAGLHKSNSARVEHAVRRVVQEVGAKDEWRVALLPSDRHGWWDLGLSGSSGWAITWFDATPEDLPNRAAATVRQLMRRSAEASRS